MTTRYNDHCDGIGPHDPGEVRALPLAGGANLHVCAVCYEREMIFRRDRNRRLHAGAQFALPTWAELRVAYPASEPA